MLTSQIPPRPLPKLALEATASPAQSIGPSSRCRPSSIRKRACRVAVRTISRCASSPIAIRTSTSPCSATSPMPPAGRAPATTRSCEVGARRFERSSTRGMAPTGSSSSIASGGGTPASSCWMGWERKRGKLAEFNRLLRGATDTSFVVMHGDLTILRVDQVRDHARLRYPAADRGRAPSGRHAVAPAQPPAVRCGGAACHRGLRRAAAAGAGQRRERQPHDVRAGVLRACRHRSVYDRRVGRLSGPVSRGQLRRQRDLRRRRLRRRARRPRAREHAAQPRPLRGLLRAGRPVHRHRICSTTTRRTTSRSPRGSTGGCAATGRSPAGCGATVPDASGRAVAQHAARRRPVEDSRQPSPQSAGAGAGDAAYRRAGRCCRARPSSGRCWRCSCWLSRPTCRWGARCRSRLRGVGLARAFSRRARQPRHQRPSGAPVDRLPARIRRS